MIWVVILLSIVSMAGLVWIALINRVNVPMPMDENDALMWQHTPEEQPYESGHFNIEIRDGNTIWQYRVPKTATDHIQAVHNLCGYLQDAGMQSISGTRIKAKR